MNRLKTGSGLKAFLLILFVLLATPLFAEIQEDYVLANAAIAMDSEMTIIFAKNPWTQLPPASTTKLVTAMVVLDNLSPDIKVKISRKAADTHSVPPKLRRGEVLTVRDLLHLALMGSVNSAAVALAETVAGSEKVFAEILNYKAFSLGADNSLFANASGLPAKRQYTTVYDLILILNESLSYPLIREILGKKQAWVRTAAGRNIIVENSNRLLWLSGSIIGGKTGFTCRAGHCFVGAIETEKGTIFTAVLGSPTRSKMWQSAGMLMGLDIPAGFEEKPDGGTCKEDPPVLKKKRRTPARSKTRRRST